jgi:hypothetical protein
MDDKKVERDRNDDEPVRAGDILGLGGAAVPKSPADKTPERPGAHGALNDEDDELNRDSAFRRSPGATGIDMGAGGSGTDVE